MSGVSYGMLSDLFVGVASKRLTLVETITPKSNQHEIQGTKALRQLFGDADRKRIPTRFIWLREEQEAMAEDGFISWSNVRKGKPRAAEYHLYYSSNAVTEAMRPGDSLFLALRPHGSAMIIIAPADSTIQNQLVWLFGLDRQPELQFTVHQITEKDSARLDFAARYILDELGIELEEPETDELDALLARFELKFPTTKEFSALARQSVRDVSTRDDPDAALFAWLEQEEMLFRRMERHIVAQRLGSGFSGNEGADVDGFISFSKTVQQRRRSRAGRALENHLEALFTDYRLSYSRGAATENSNRPDFLFPSANDYHNLAFPPKRLTMLGVKFTLKDRWRQVLVEANRIREKHLLTLEPGITVGQTNQIRQNDLQLVIPKPLHETFAEGQRAQILTVRSFLELVEKRQSA